MLLLRWLVKGVLHLRLNHRLFWWLLWRFLIFYRSRFGFLRRCLSIIIAEILEILSVHCLMFKEILNQTLQEFAVFFQQLFAYFTRFIKNALYLVINLRRCFF